MDSLVLLLAPLPGSPPTFPPRPPVGHSQPVGCRWDTLGSTPSSEPAQMAAGIPLGSRVVSKKATVKWVNAVKRPIYESLSNDEEFKQY